MHESACGLPRAIAAHPARVSQVRRCATSAARPGVGFRHVPGKMVRAADEGLHRYPGGELLPGGTGLRGA